MLMATLAKCIEKLDRRRRSLFGTLSKQNHSVVDQQWFPPIRSEIIFLLPRGEPFFEFIYTRLRALREQTRPRAHFGIGNVRNLSIIGGTKADAGILGYYNLHEQDAMNAVADVAVSLYGRRGERASPAEFIEAFAAHPIQRILRSVPQGQDLHTDLSQELAVSESWLSSEQDDDRFLHVIRLFARGRIGTIGLNIVDQTVFSEIQNVLGLVSRGDPELQGLTVQTVFLANLMYHLGRPESYIEFGTEDCTPRNATTIVWNNLRKIASDDTYVVFAHEFPMDLYRNNGSEYFAVEDKVDGPPKSALAVLAQCDSETKIPYLSAAEAHYCDWRPYHYSTMGGRLGVVRKKLPPMSKENPVYGPTYPGRRRVDSH
jgi:hypothetical protein